MKFHDETIVVGDRVFHIRYGYLPVIEVNENYFLVEGQGKRHHVTSDGMTMGAPLFFWHNPHVTLPPKDGDKWDKVKAIALAVSEVVG